MRRGILALLWGFALTLPVSAHPEEALSGFQNLTWGDSPKLVMQKLSAHYHDLSYEPNGEISGIGDFAGYRNCTVYAGFTEQKLDDVVVTVSSQDSMSTRDIFDNLGGMLVKLYGVNSSYRYGPVGDKQGRPIPPEEVNKDTLDSYWREVFAGHAFIRASWDFKNDAVITLDTAYEERADTSVPLCINLEYFSRATEKAATRSHRTDY